MSASKTHHRTHNKISKKEIIAGHGCRGRIFGLWFRFVYTVLCVWRTSALAIACSWLHFPPGNLILEVQKDWEDLNFFYFFEFLNVFLLTLLKYILPVLGIWFLCDVCAREGTDVMKWGNCGIRNYLYLPRKNGYDLPWMKRYAVVWIDQHSRIHWQYQESHHSKNVF